MKSTKETVEVNPPTQPGRSIEDRRRDLLITQRILADARSEWTQPLQSLSAQASRKTAKLLRRLSVAETVLKNVLADLDAEEAIYRAIGGMDDNARAELERQLRQALDAAHEAAH